MGRTFKSTVLLGTGAVAALLPAALQAIGAREFALEDQGKLAIVLSLATLVSQLALTSIVEARLATAIGLRRVRIPYVLSALAVIASAAVALLPTQIFIVCLALPFWLAALEVGRAACVIEGKTAQEFFATLSLVLGVALGFVLSAAGLDDGFRWLSLGVAGAVMIRGWVKRYPVDSVLARHRAWLVADTLVTGSTQPVVTAFLFMVMGPQSAVIFRLLSTVSGALAPAINFLRLRLLKRHSSSDLMLAGAATLAILLLLAALDFFGAFSIAFGSAWEGVTVAALWAACAWRVSSLLATPPFAVLRRLGRVQMLFGLRVISTGLYATLSLLAALSQQVVLIFLGMLGAELLSALLYASVARRLR